MQPKSKKPFTLTASLEDYLEAVKILIDSHGHAHTNAIAQLLGVKMPSVTSAMGILRANGYVNYELNNPVTLTKAGEKAAMRVMLRHRTLSSFFRDGLNIPEADAESMACSIEHMITDELLAKLQILTDALTGGDPAYARLRETLAQPSTITNTK